MSPEGACVSESALMAFFAGELPLDRISEIERHLDGCAACTALVQTVAPLLVGQSGGPPAIWALPPEAQPGTRLAQRYRLEALLGWGATGFVLRAHDELLGIRVAVKMVRPELSLRPAWLDRLARELQVARALAHRHVCRVFELVTGPTPFLVMELAERSLRDELLAAPPVPDPAALDGRLADAQALTSGLVAMHDAGILHRDIKPANVLRLADGRLALSDFGLASIAPERSAATRFVGTPSYMAPEVIAGEAAARPSDVFSLGMVLHELLFGRRPEWQSRGGRRSLVRPDRRWGRRARAAARLCESCLSPLPEERPGSARLVLSRLGAVRAGRRLFLPRRLHRRDLVMGSFVAGAAAWYLYRRLRLLPARGMTAEPRLWMVNGSRPSMAAGVRGTGIVNRWPERGFLHVMDTQGGGMGFFASTEDGKDAVLSPNGVLVAFVSEPPGEMSFEESIWLLDRVSRRRTFLAMGSAPQWLWEGSRLYFYDHRREVLCLYDASQPGSIPRIVHHHPRSASYSLSGDGRRILFGTAKGLSWADGPDRDYYSEWSAPTRRGLTVALSPDGRLAAFGGYQDDPIGIWVLDLEVRRAVRIKGGLHGWPVWDASSLFFDSRGDGPCSIWRIGRDAIEEALPRGLSQDEFLETLRRERS
jgi:Protein kinase domain/Putative zinc-finger